MNAVNELGGQLSLNFHHVQYLSGTVYIIMYFLEGINLSFNFGSNISLDP